MIVDLIGNTTTTTGLTVHCVLDTDQYPTGITYTAKDVDTLPIRATSSTASGTTPSSRHARRLPRLFCRASLPLRFMATALRVQIARRSRKAS